MDDSQKISAFEKRIKRQVIGKPRRFLAIAPLGFEQTLVEELKSIGIESTAVGDGKVEFTAKIVEAWKAVAYSRIANRVLMHIADFKAENFRELEKKASEIPWELYLPATPDIANIHVTCKHSRLYHSDAIAERLYKVIGEALGSPAPSHPDAGQDQHSSPERHPDVGQDRLLAPERHPDVGQDRLLAPERHPDVGQDRHLATQNLYINFLDDRCTIWLDLAGEELYKRGHERYVNDAPLKETIAAGMLFEVLLPIRGSCPLRQQVAKWSKRLRAAPSAQDDTSIKVQDDTKVAPSSTAIPSHTPHYTLFDLMAGSGTFSLEAAYKASELIPGVCRDFALKHQPAFKEASWNHILGRRQASSDLGINILTSDISERAVEIIRHNVECSPLAQNQTRADAEPETKITLDPQQRDFFTYTAAEIAAACPEGSQPAIVLNPPYGKRLDCDAPKLYTQIGRKLTELSRDLKPLGKSLTVAILAPKDDTRNGAKYTCTSNLLRECPSLDPARNPKAKKIVTSHGGFSLNALISAL